MKTIPGLPYVCNVPTYKKNALNLHYIPIIIYLVVVKMNAIQSRESTSFRLIIAPYMGLVVTVDGSWDISDSFLVTWHKMKCDVSVNL